MITRRHLEKIVRRRDPGEGVFGGGCEHLSRSGWVTLWSLEDATAHNSRQQGETERHGSQCFLACESFEKSCRRLTVKSGGQKHVGKRTRILESCATREAVDLNAMNHNLMETDRNNMAKNI